MIPGILKADPLGGPDSQGGVCDNLSEGLFQEFFPSPNELPRKVAGLRLFGAFHWAPIVAPEREAFCEEVPGKEWDGSKLPENDCLILWPNFPGAELRESPKRLLKAVI